MLKLWDSLKVQPSESLLVAEWIHFTLFGIILRTIKRKVYTFGGLWTQQLRPKQCSTLGSQRFSWTRFALCRVWLWCLFVLNLWFYDFRRGEDPTPKILQKRSRILKRNFRKAKSYIFKTPIGVSWLSLCFWFHLVSAVLSSARWLSMNFWTRHASKRRPLVCPEPLSWASKNRNTRNCPQSSNPVVRALKNGVELREGNWYDTLDNWMLESKGTPTLPPARIMFRIEG